LTSTNVVVRGARRGRAIVRSRLYYGLLWNVVLRSRAKARHRACVASAEHTDTHTYTAFHRSPPQLAFSITASDLHEETVAKAIAASYTLEEIAQGQDVPAEFIERTFDRVGDAYVVKEHIRSHVTFAQADLLDPALNERFDAADIVLAQNVLFHMPPDLAHRAFANIIGLLRPGAVLLVEGMDLDQRVALTRAAGLEPMRLRTRQIHRYARRHLAANWWDYYYGCEPYFALARDRSRRYGTIFVDSDQSERATASAIATQRSTQEWSTRSGVSSRTW
jgi:SAM-dependent methyltransferase